MTENRPPEALGKRDITINVVAKNDGWILWRWAEQWARLFGSVPSQTPSASGVNLYVNYYQYKKSKAFDVAYFTHKEASDLHLRETFDDVANGCDLCIAQCETTRRVLLEESNVKLSPKDVPVVYPGVDERFRRTKRIGIIGREYSTGRKRFDIVKAIVLPGIEFATYSDVPYHKMPGVYREIDYLLVTAEREGGPMPVAEAISMGVPVIMPEGVGWYSEVPCFTYKNYTDLEELLRGISGWIDWEESATRMRSAIESHL